MADEPQATSTAKWLLIAVAVVLVVFLLWQFGMFGTGQEETERTFEAGVTDASGGDLIVRERDPAEVPVTVPNTPMTNVPPDTESPSPPPPPE